MMISAYGWDSSPSQIGIMVESDDGINSTIQNRVSSQYLNCVCSYVGIRVGFRECVVLNLVVHFEEHETDFLL